MCDFGFERLHNDVVYINCVVLNKDTGVPIIDNQISIVKNQLNCLQGLIAAHASLEKDFADGIAVANAHSSAKALALEPVPLAAPEQLTPPKTLDVESVTLNQKQATPTVEPVALAAEPTMSTVEPVVLAAELMATPTVEPVVLAAEPTTPTVKSATLKAELLATPTIINIKNITAVNSGAVTTKLVPEEQPFVSTQLSRPQNKGIIHIEKRKIIVYFTDNYNVDWLKLSDKSLTGYKNVTVHASSQNACFAHTRLNGVIFTLQLKKTKFFVDIQNNLHYLNTRNNTIRKYTANEEIIMPNGIYFTCMSKWVSGIRDPITSNYWQGYFNHQDVVHKQGEFITPGYELFVRY